MHNLNEDVEKIMQLLGELSERAKRLGCWMKWAPVNITINVDNRSNADGEA